MNSVVPMSDGVKVVRSVEESMVGTSRGKDKHDGSQQEVVRHLDPGPQLLIPSLEITEE